MSEATKRPWAVEDDDTIQSACGRTICSMSTSDNFPCIEDEDCEDFDAEVAANASLIVRAVNSHDALVAVAEAARQVVAKFDALPPDEPTRMVPLGLNALRAALLAAEKPNG